MSSSWSEGGVDPAAQILAVLAVGVGIMTSDGDFTAVSTMVAGTVLALLLVLSWPVGSERLAGRALWSSAIVIGFAAGVAAGWPVQLWWAGGHDNMPGFATMVGVGFGWGIALLIGVGLTLWEKRRSRH